MAEANNHQILLCRVKWFDPVKGFGFLVPDEGGPDILLHVNVLRNAGRSNVADGVRLKAIVTVVTGKWQAISIEAIEPEPGHSTPKLSQLAAIDPDDLQSLPFQPARVKWFDEAKGIGFANVFGSAEDVFIHIEVLRASGLATLDAGEAIALRVFEGDRGLLAAEVKDWISAQA